jgi:hypothetical protein
MLIWMNSMLKYELWTGPPLAKVLMADKISTTVRKNTQTLNIIHHGNAVFYRY